MNSGHGGGLQPMSARAGFDSRSRVSGPDKTSKEMNTSIETPSASRGAGPHRD